LYHLSGTEQDNRVVVRGEDQVLLGNVYGEHEREFLRIEVFQPDNLLFQQRVDLVGLDSTLAEEVDIFHPAVGVTGHQCDVG